MKKRGALYPKGDPVERAEGHRLRAVTLTLDAECVELLDRLAAAAGSNRSAELRALMRQWRPVILAAVVALERQRDAPRGLS